MKNKFTTNIRRIIASGGRGFSRNKTVSFASIFILVITLVIIIFLFFCKGMFDYSINRLESKVNIIVYFKPDISEDNIFKVREKITNYNGVSDIVYNSEDDRLEKFKSDNRDDSNIQNTLDIIGVNPLGASLVIKSQDTLAYTDIYKQINKDFDLGGNGDIDKVNYLDIKDAIDNINNTVS
ncbi:MAG: permease-like cell division protein FtsX [Candidatus Pacebacteria bacterium]|nr:permease-like cell division protein FtsX [Candidatus Paceibacterota bacterium]